jgi:hypothetical protein
MRPPTPPKILTCGHVEHPPLTGYCQTIDCPNHETPEDPNYHGFTHLDCTYDLEGATWFIRSL